MTDIYDFEELSPMSDLMIIKDYSATVCAVNNFGEIETVRQSSDNEIYSVEQRKFFNVNNYQGWFFRKSNDN